MQETIYLVIGSNAYEGYTLPIAAFYNKDVAINFIAQNYPYYKIDSDGSYSKNEDYKNKIGYYKLDDYLDIIEMVISK